ncbi:MAG: hypothetical protein ABWX96_02840 [Propionibacteriaceae bacterium]
MTTSSTYRLAGRLLVIAFLLCFAGGLTHPIVDGQAHSVDSLNSPASPWAQYLILAGTVALLIGLPLLYAHLAPRLGWLGLIGTALYLVGNATCAMAHLVVESMVAVPLAADPATAGLVPADGTLFPSSAFQATQMVGGPLLLLGQLLLGIAVLRAKFPRWIGVLLVVGAVLAVLPIPEVAVVPGFTFELPRGLAVAALGLLMVRDNPPHSATHAVTPTPLTADIIRR